MNRLIEMDKFVGQGGEGFAVRQVAHAYTEEGAGQEWNVTPYRFVKRSDGVIADRDSGREICLDREMEFGRQEAEGAENMFRLAEGGSDLIFWISPAGGSYVDARLVVARAESLAGEMVLDCRGIVVRKTPEDLLQIAMNMVCFEGGRLVSGVIEAEDLRSQPIGIKLKGGDWIAFSERMFGIPEVWRAIRMTEDIVLRDKIEMAVGNAFQDLKSSGLRGIDLDLALEMGMVLRGYRLNAMGNHGGSMLGLNGKGGIFNSVFNEGSRIRFDSKGKIEIFCNMCHRWYTGDKCPYCS